MVFEDEISLGFLDEKPLFPVHVLLIPRGHYQTLADLPPDLPPEGLVPGLCPTPALLTSDL